MSEYGAASPLSSLIRQHLKAAVFFGRLLTPVLCLDAVTQDLKSKTVVQILESNCSFCPSGVNSGCEGQRGEGFQREEEGEILWQNRSKCLKTGCKRRRLHRAPAQPDGPTNHKTKGPMHTRIRPVLKLLQSFNYTQR